MSTFVRFDACLLSIALIVSVTGPTLSKLLSPSERQKEPSEARWLTAQRDTEGFSLGLERTRALLKTRNYQVPPFFASLGGASVDGALMDEDPFAEGYVSRRSAINILRSRGIKFGECTSATYHSDTSTLTVTNRPAQLAIVDRFRANLIEEGVPIQIKVEAKPIESTQDDLREFGFDWDLGNLEKKLNDRE